MNGALILIFVLVAVILTLSVILFSKNLTKSEKVGMISLQTLAAFFLTTIPPNL